MSLDPAIQVFEEECRDLLQQMEDCLFELDKGDTSSELIDAIFRAAHTIKGTSGIFGFSDVVAFTHEIEFILDAIRKNERQISADLVSALFPACDHIEKIVKLAIQEQDLDDDLRQQGLDIFKQLGVNVAEKTAAEEVVVNAEPESVEQEWSIRVEFAADSLREGMEPLSFLRYLASEGEVSDLKLDFSRLPSADEFDALTCYLSYELDYTSCLSEQEITEVFEFIIDDSDVQISKKLSLQERYQELAKSIRQQDKQLCDTLLKNKALELAAFCDFLAKAEDDRRLLAGNLGDILSEQGLCSGSDVKTALEQIQNKAKSKSKSNNNETIRVEAFKLDQLVNLVGELVTATANTHLLTRNVEHKQLSDSVDSVLSLVEGIRECSLKLRMVPIDVCFSRFKRVVRDIGRELGKDIVLEIEGEDTELDKAVIEKLTDPLMHMVRNSLDHGIESKEQRLAAGKPEQGRLKLNAYHEMGGIVIEIEDDGAGIPQQHILSKAKEKGLVSDDEVLSEQDIFQLIFAAGFSTAETVSNISGRGVGMDVVRRNIEALRGNIEVFSTEGEGTTMKIHLPLTLAIIDGFLVKVGQCNYVFPLDMIEQCIEYEGGESEHGAIAGYTNLRGEVLPFLRLSRLFDDSPSQQKHESLVVVQYGNTRAGLLVDELLGEFQTVIKPLGHIFNQLSWVTGSTILGTGDIALILDVSGLVKLTTNTILQEQKS